MNSLQLLVGGLVRRPSESWEITHYSQPFPAIVVLRLCWDFRWKISGSSTEQVRASVSTSLATDLWEYSVQRSTDAGSVTYCDLRDGRQSHEHPNELGDREQLPENWNGGERCH